MGGGSSESTTSPSTKTSQTTGGSGADSTTIDASGNVSVETGGKDVTLAAIENMTAIVDQALKGAAAFTAVQQTASTAQTASDAALLSNVLNSNASLAQHTSTGGADLAVTQSNYLLWALAGLAALALAFFAFKR